MGQYYFPVILHDDGTVNTMYSHDYHSGLKLMEHSYIGNKFVNAVLSQIENNPKRIAWVGDYSDGQDGSPYEEQVMSRMAWDDFIGIYAKAMNDEGKICPDPIEYGMESRGWFLVNHFKFVYIDLDKYIDRNKWIEKWTDWQTGKTEESEWCVNPLPLLTACGNDRGGGDYHGCYPDSDLVGTWAFDLIEFTKVRRADYEEVMFDFTEQREKIA